MLSHYLYCIILLHRSYDTANLPTNIMDFGGFDSSIILSLRGGILMSIGDFPECLSQAILVRIILVGKSGVIGNAGHVEPGACNRMISELEDLGFTAIGIN